MKLLDLYNVIQKKWANKRDIMKLCSCSEEEAYKILMNLDWLTREYNIKIPKNNSFVVPMWMVLDYIGEERVERIKRYHNELNIFYLRQV